MIPPRPPSLADRAWRSAAFRLTRCAENVRRRALGQHLAALGLPRLGSIPTWTSGPELEALYQLACACPRGGNIVEIGSYLGASTCCLAAGAAQVGGRVTAIDLWNNQTIGEPRDIFADFTASIRAAAGLIAVVRKHTRDLVPADVQPPIDLAFIDADHSYEATRDDAAFIAPLLAPGGVIAFHDTIVFEGVGRAVAELLVTGEWCLGGKAESLAWIRRARWTPWPPPAGAAAGT